jgi:RNA polymerase sigma-70 factor (ECF subfamily)
MIRAPAFLAGARFSKEFVNAMSPEHLMDLPDVELVQLCQVRGAKDDRLFQELFRRYQGIVWRVCFSFTRNPQDAEDLTQEVFFKAYRALGKFEGQASFKTWIYRIAINTSQNEIRRRSSRPKLSETNVETMADYLPAATSVETELQKKKQQEQLGQALAQLPPEVYEIVHLKDLEHRPYSEIAQILNVSVSAAKMRVQRARIALRVVYRQMDGKE